MARTALALDIGTCSITAVSRDAEGRIATVANGDRDTFAARLVVADDLTPQPLSPGMDYAQDLGPLLTRLGGGDVLVENTSWSFSQLTRLVLAPVMAAAERQLGAPPDEVLLILPWHWTEQQKLAFQRAVHTALGRQVAPIPSDKAAAFAVPQARSSVSIVVDAGASALTMVAIADGVRGPRIIGRNMIEGGGDNFDRVLLADAITAAGFPDHATDPRWAWLGVPRVRAARESLVEADVVTVDLPRPVGAVDLTADDVDSTGVHYLSQQLTDLMSSPLALEPSAGARRRSIVICGGLALDPATSDAVKEVTSAAARIAPDPAHALCRGALSFSVSVDSTDDPAPRSVVQQKPATHDKAGLHAGARWRGIAYGASGAATAALVIAAVMAWSSSVTAEPEISDEAARSLVNSVLPQSASLDGWYLKRWNSADGVDDQTLLRGHESAATLACGGDPVTDGAEKAGIRLQAARMFVVSPAAAGPSPRGQFDRAHVGEHVIVDATVLSRANVDEIWAAVESQNVRCPSTARNVVRNIVPIPVNGPDPGPPTYAKDENRLTTPSTTPTRAHGGGGVSTAPDRLAWRGLISAAQTGNTDLNVTCIATRDGVVIRRACVAMKESAAADQLAATAIAAFNPVPKTEGPR